MNEVFQKELDSIAAKAYRESWYAEFDKMDREARLGAVAEIELLRKELIGAANCGRRLYEYILPTNNRLYFVLKAMYGWNLMVMISNSKGALTATITW